MKRVVLAFAALAGFSTPALAQYEEGLAAIPRVYQGRWHASLAGCAEPQSTANPSITITARGWTAWEEGGHVTRVGQVRGTTRYFAVRNAQAGDETEQDGTIALQMTGHDRLSMSFNQRGWEPVHYALVRCRG